MIGATTAYGPTYRVPGAGDPAAVALTVRAAADRLSQLVS
jgi:hypothetical protein